MMAAESGSGSRLESSESGLSASLAGTQVLEVEVSEEQEGVLAFLTSKPHVPYPNYV
jgi:hypothetical protein